MGARPVPQPLAACTECGDVFSPKPAQANSGDVLVVQRRWTARVAHLECDRRADFLVGVCASIFSSTCAYRHRPSIPARFANAYRTDPNTVPTGCNLGDSEWCLSGIGRALQ